MNNIPPVILSSRLSLSALSANNITTSRSIANDCYNSFTNTVSSFFESQLSSIWDSFNTGIIKKELSSEEKVLAKNMLERVLVLIRELNPSQITFAVTWDKSLYFRLKKDNFDIHTEFFFTIDEEETEGEEIEIVSTIYDENVIILKQFGYVEKVWAIITQTTQPKSILAKDLLSSKFLVKKFPKKYDNLSTAVSTSDSRYNSRFAQS